MLLAEFAEVSQLLGRLVAEVAQRFRQPVDEAGHAFAAHRIANELRAVGRFLHCHGGKRQQRNDHQQHNADHDDRGGQAAPPAEFFGQPLLQRPQHHREDGGQKQRARQGPGDEPHRDHAADQQNEEEAAGRLVLRHGRTAYWSW